MTTVANYPELWQLSQPWFHAFIGTRADLTNFAWSLDPKGTRNFAIRTVRGPKMGTAPRLFDEISAAFQFPDYFGENWAALDECLGGLSWLPAAGYVIVIQEALRVLGDEQPDQFGLCLNGLARTAREWSTPVRRGEWWDRPGKPFHIVLHATPDDKSALFGRVREATEPMSELTWSPTGDSAREAGAEGPARDTM
jgi:hypothetical protein